MLYLPINSTFIVLSFVALVAFTLYIREYFLRKKEHESLKNISQETKQKSLQLLQAAQAAESQVLYESNYATQKLVVEFKNHLQDLVENSEASISASQTKLIQFIDNLQKTSQQSQDVLAKSAEQRVDRLFENLENRLSDFLASTGQKTISSIELELKGARNLIETYKDQQLKLIDENIIAMMEQTLNIVLAKKLSLKDQIDLVYEALEKAKIEKFVV